MIAAHLQEHQTLCQELYQLALEENRFLRQHQRAPESGLLGRKRQLVQRLEHVLVALREIPAASIREGAAREQLEHTRGRILQILQLDKENERLLLRYSLTGHRPHAPATSASARASTSILQRIYARCT